MRGKDDHDHPDQEDENSRCVSLEVELGLRDCRGDFRPPAPRALRRFLQIAHPETILAKLVGLVQSDDGIPCAFAVEVSTAPGLEILDGYWFVQRMSVSVVGERFRIAMGQ